MKVGDIMTASVISVTQAEPVAAAARLMKRHNLGALPVCDSLGRLKGIVTDRDIVTRCIAAGMSSADTSIREIMSRGITCCDAADDAGLAAAMMARKQIRRLPVLQNGKLAGMLSLADLARSSRFRSESTEALSEISSNIRRS